MVLAPLVLSGLASVVSLSTPSGAAAPARACALPSLPRPGTRVNGAPTMTGPAVGALTGHAVTATFSLDHGDLVVAPPERGDRPKVSSNYAECNALASQNVDNDQLSSFADSGVGVGYGRVTVAEKLFPPAQGPPGTDITPGFVAPKMPPSQPYQRRLAWVVVFREDLVASCPAERVETTFPPALATDYNYEVFLIDADTGRDALIYQESEANPCGFATRVPPSLDEPQELVSVPWTLVSRNPDGYSGTISATVLPCDGYQSPVLIDRGSPTLQVVVNRPVGADCGAPGQVTMGVNAAVVTADLPGTIGHDPLGLELNLPQRGPTSGPAKVATPPTTVPFINLDAQSNGRTVHVEVGNVLVVDSPGSQATGPAPNPVTSSNPGVLGPLGPGQPIVAEFRAWKPGRATLSVPTSACRSPGSVQVPCTTPWIVHVVVR